MYVGTVPSLLESNSVALELIHAGLEVFGVGIHTRPDLALHLRLPDIFGSCGSHTFRDPFYGTVGQVRKVANLGITQNTRLFFQVLSPPEHAAYAVPHANRLTISPVRPGLLITRGSRPTIGTLESFLSLSRAQQCDSIESSATMYLIEYVLQVVMYLLYT